jgi:hypothetical protein
MKKFGTFPQMTLASNPYTCKEPGCGKSYRKPSDLVAHRRWHDKEGGYVCEFPNCEMRFTDWQSLRRHWKTHAGEISYKCDVIKETFSRSDRRKETQKIHGLKVSFVEERKVTIIANNKWSQRNA